MSDLIIPDGVIQYRKPIFIGKRSVSAFIEDENGMTGQQTEEIQLDFADDPMGIMYLAIFQTLEIEIGKMREEIEVLRKEIQQLMGERK